MRLNRRVLTLVGVLVLVGSCSPAETGGGPTESSEPSTTSSTSQIDTTTTTSPVWEATTTSTAQDTTTTTVADWEEGEAEAALATIDNFYAAVNEGDLRTAFGLLTPRRFGFDDNVEIAVAGLNAEFVHDCTPASAKGMVTCIETMTDDLYGPAGISNQSTVEYRYSDGRLATSDWPQPFVCAGDPTGDALDFLMEFRVWSADVHPELEAFWIWGEPIDSPEAIPCTVYPFADEYEAKRICEIVPEFIAQSDNWPTNNT